MIISIYKIHIRIYMYSKPQIINNPPKRKQICWRLLEFGRQTSSIEASTMFEKNGKGVSLFGKYAISYYLRFIFNVLSSMPTNRS